MGNDWRDVTSYAQGEATALRKPRVFHLEFMGARLVVHRIHRLPGWYWSMYDGGNRLVQDRPLGDDDMTHEEAKFAGLTEALEFLKARQQRYEDLVLTVFGMKVRSPQR